MHGGECVSLVVRREHCRGIKAECDRCAVGCRCQHRALRSRTKLLFSRTRWVLLEERIRDLIVVAVRPAVVTAVDESVQLLRRNVVPAPVTAVVHSEHFMCFWMPIETDR